MHAVCPTSGAAGKRVRPLTLRSLVEESRLPQLDDEQWYFCPDPGCGIAYFSPNGETIHKEALQVRVGLKESQAPHPVCYCFDHSLESIREEIERTGRSTVVDSITERVKAGECSCEIKNPKGSCCLADVRKVVKMETDDRDTSDVAGMSAGTEACCSGAGVCDTADSPPPARRTGLWAVGGSLFSAILASACCWLPLTFIAFGVSTAGLSSAFERLRPVFLGATSLFLMAGFYFAYFRKDACAPGEACAAPNPRLKRFNRVMLWVATVVVAGVALFPNYASVLMGGSAAPTTAVNDNGAQSLDLRIEGMTCAACSIHVQSKLEKVAGVTSAAVSYDEGRARVIVDPESPPEMESLVAAVERAGYAAHAAANDEENPSDR